MFNIKLGIYIILAIALIAGGAFKLFQGGRSISALLYLVGTIAIFAVFGIRWFGSSGSLFSDTPVQWPPTINSCPDYLMHYKRKMPDGSYQDTCVDSIGVSRNGTLKVFPQDGDVNTENDTYFFSLQTKSSDPIQRNMELCQRCIQYGLTWEGICNGESCIGPNGPVNPIPTPTPGSGGCP